MNNGMVSWRCRSGRALALLTLGLLSVGAWAQDLNDFVISEEAARATLNRAEISVDTAESVAKACVRFAEENDVVVAIFVLGPSGNVVYAYRMDGQNPVAVDTARMKAGTVLYMRESTHATLTRYGLELRPTFFHLGQFPFTGGLPIMVGDQLIGAIGVGGASGAQDQQCAYDALTEVIGPQPPLVED